MAFFGLLPDKKNKLAPMAPSPLEREQESLYALKREALSKATQIAQAAGRAPNLKDYIAVAESLSDRAAAEGVQWGARVYADLSHQRLSGFEINQQDYKNAPEGFEVNMNFTGATLHNCVLKPACVYDVTTGAYLENVTLDGMSADETLTLTGQHHQHISLENIKGGTIELEKGAVVNGMNISRQHASLKLGEGATLNDLESNGARIVELSAAAGASLNRPHFKDTTISMASALSGSTWRGAKDKNTFENCNLSNTDFSGTTLVDVSLKETDVKGWNLSGANIKHLTIDGVAVTSVKELQKLGIQYDSRTSFAGASKASALGAAMGADVGHTLNNAMMSVLKPQPIEAPKPTASTVPPALSNPGIEGAAIGAADPRNIWAQKEEPKQPPIPAHPVLGPIAASMQHAAKEHEIPEYLRVKAEKNEAFLARMRLSSLSRKDT